MAAALGACASPSAAAVVGTGTPASCTSARVVAAVAKGGLVTFDCGPKPVVIRMTRTAKVINTSPRVVIDGGGKVTLDGQGRRRILYQNTCDKRQVWTTSHCQDQATPRLEIRDIAMVRGDSTGDLSDNGGGGAVFARGGTLTIRNVRFAGNRCDPVGPDVAGAAVRAFSQHRNRPIPVIGSTFTGGRCSNGGAIGGIGVSWRIVRSTFTGNRATGRGANPQRPGTPGGGNGGAIYMDGNLIRLDVRDTTITRNVAPEGGGAVFFVSNDRSGTARITGSRLTGNPSLGFETRGLPGIFFLGARPPAIVRSTLTR